MSYQKGDKYRIHIEGSENYFRYTHDVIDYIASTVHFEFDKYDANINLKDLNKHESIKFRSDCTVTRIA